MHDIVVTNIRTSGPLPVRKHNSALLRRHPSPALVLAHDGVEGLLAERDVSDGFHALLALALLGQQLLLARDVAAAHHLPVPAEDVLAEGRDAFLGEDLPPDRRLDDDLELLARDRLAQLAGDAATLADGLVAVGDEAQRVHGLGVDQHVHLHDGAALVGARGPVQ